MPETRFDQSVQNQIERLRPWFKTRRTWVKLIIGCITFCLFGLSNALLASEWKILPTAPTDGVFRGVPGPDGLVRLVLDKNDKSLTNSVKVSLSKFWTVEGEPFDIQLLNAGDNEPQDYVKITPGQPIILKAKGIPDGQYVWGALKIGDNELVLPLVLGRFGPDLTESGDEISVPGQSSLKIDMTQYRAFGDEAHFILVPFRPNERTPKVVFAKTREHEAGLERTQKIPKGQDTLNLEIDASSLLPDEIYRGALRVTIGGHRFIETPLNLRRQKWGVNATFAPIQSALGENEVLLLLRTATEKPIFGITVDTNASEATAVFNPSNLDVIFNSDAGAESLWTLDARNPDQIVAQSLIPGSQHEVIVKPRLALSAGTYTTTLRFGALNVDPKNWPEATVTFVVRHNSAFAIIILVIAVMISYTTSKGLSTALRRRNLRLRIASIRRTSWLRKNRWGALPIVRALGRVALSDRVLRHGRGLKGLTRMITTPDLIVDEIAEVEKRLPPLERLNKLAVYWKTAPTTSGAKVTGVDPMVVRRAQKILQKIVTQLNQLHEGENVETAIISQIEALEAWTEREHMETGYWTSLRSDIRFLLDTVQVEEFTFDEITLSKLADKLRNAVNDASEDKVQSALASALIACSDAPEEGVQNIDKLLAPVYENIANAEEVKGQLDKLKCSQREVIRRLQHAIDISDMPGSLNTMIRVEGNYAYLKLIWEQRGDNKRREQLFTLKEQGEPVDRAFRFLDDEVWERLKQKDVVRIAPPDRSKIIEEYELIDLEMVCTDMNANTFLFKHGLEYEWRIDYGGERPLTPITRSPMVTQFISVVAEVNVSVIMIYKNDRHQVNSVKLFNTVPTTRFKDLWPVPTTELIGIGFSLLLALVAGFQSNAFNSALAGSWNEYLALFAWGVGADQTRNLLQNLDTFTKGEDAAVD